MTNTHHEEHTDNQEALYRISNLIIQSSDQSSFLHAALDVLQEVFGFRVISVWLHDEATRTVAPASYRVPGPLPEIWHEPIPVGPDAPSLGAQVVHAGQPLFTADWASHPASPAVQKVLDVQPDQAVLGLPMMVGGTILGAVIFVLPHNRRPPVEKERLLQAAVNQIAAGIHRLRIEAQLAQRMADLERMVEERTAALAASEARYRALVEQMPGIVFARRLDGRNSFVSQQLSERLGYSVEEALGSELEDWAQAVHPDDRERNGQQWAEALANKTPLRTQFRIRHKLTGEWRWLEEHADVVQLGPGEEQFIGVALDVTERKRLEEELDQARARLVEERARLQRLIELLPDGVLVVDPDGIVVLANRAALDLSGTAGKTLLGRRVDRLPREETLWRTVLDLYHQADPAAHLRMLPGLSADELKTVLIEARKIALSVGEPPSTVIVFRDVTHLAELDRMKSKLVADISHELRGPLTVALMAIEQLRQMITGRIKAQTADLIDPIRGQLLTLDRLVQQLADVSRLDAVDRPLDRSVFDLVLLIRGLVRDYQVLAKDADVALRTRLDVPDCLIDMDMELIGRALRNLLDNAIKYTPRRGRVTVGLTVSGDQALVSVTDTGLGIPADQLSRIFERFYRPPGSAGYGLGLGLSIVKEIVELHGGLVEVQSGEGQGTTFTLRLPTTRPDVA